MTAATMPATMDTATRGATRAATGAATHAATGAATHAATGAGTRAGGMNFILVAFAAAALLFVLAAAPRAARADEPGDEASGNVFVSRPGKMPLRAKPALDAPAKGAVGYGQKLVLKRRVSGASPWLLVQIPGDPTTGWIPAQATIDKRPAIDATPLADASDKIKAAELTTSNAIRGLDGRTAAYAKDKQLPPEVFDQLSRVEGFGEQLFSDRHTTDPKGGWHYPDVTAPGRITAATQFANPEGLVPPRLPSSAPAPAGGAGATPAAAATAAPAATPAPAK